MPSLIKHVLKILDASWVFKPNMFRLVVKTYIPSTLVLLLCSPQCYLDQQMEPFATQWYKPEAWRSFLTTSFPSPLMVYNLQSLGDCSS